MNALKASLSSVDLRYDSLHPAIEYTDFSQFLAKPTVYESCIWHQNGKADWQLNSPFSANRNI